MFPNLFPLLRSDSRVTDIIGSSPVRAYKHGDAPQAVAAPYVTWFVVSGTPENQLSGRPPVDAFQVQVDCWSDNTGTGVAGIETLAAAVRDAIEERWHMVSSPSFSRDPQTMRYRASMTFAVWQAREPVSQVFRLSGDSSGSALLLSGDMTDGNDRLLVNGG